MISLSPLLIVCLSVKASTLPLSAHKREDINLDSAPTGNWKWRETDTVFSFGDSYTYESFNVTTEESGGTASNGPNWVQYLTETYNVSNPIHRWNVAYAGAVIDNDVITPYTPSVKSIKDQVEEFETYAASGSYWDAEKSLCSVWIGINDIGFNYAWKNVSIPEFYRSEIENLHSLLTRVSNLDACRAFLFITVPPLGSVPLYLSQGAEVSSSIDYATEVWNAALKEMASRFEDELNETWVGVFDSGRVFNTIIENGEALGYTNVTGYNPVYPIQYGVKQDGNNSQIEPFLPTSSYLWQDSLHPTWPIHNILAHSIATFLGAVHVV
ncbi:hypothetical protein BDY24DRAFT_383333 [Mrakia frigida]|uniref:SGNH/GDSL hydrolase family protein n=1 Tax=Mrakia frigida TaxID=29902 RepID=UPI003FCC0BB9